MTHIPLPPADPTPPRATSGITLDDLRHPDFGGRVWGYDREEVDALLASVVTTVERLQRRRHRDATAIEALTRKAEAAQARADEIERHLSALSSAVEEAEQEASEGQRRGQDAEQRAQDAEQRAEEAERRAVRARRREPRLPPVIEVATVDEDDERVLESLPLAVRAARGLLREARSQAASILAEAEERARALDLAAGDHENAAG